MKFPTSQNSIEQAITIADELSRQNTDGKWLERLTVQNAPHIREWDLAECWAWAEWPGREQQFPGTTNQDVGIDCVAVRRSDGKPIAIQCKSRQLDEHGRGAPINKSEFDSFASASSSDFWAERWIVTNGDNPLGPNPQQIQSMHRTPIKAINIVNDLRLQQAGRSNEECPHCQPNPKGEARRQTRTCMQNEAVAESVRFLREHERADRGNRPLGQARGKIILPCGTGKTRISLRIVEELTPPGQLSIVLCPSIALVAQIRREYLQHTTGGLRALAVCSDETAGYDPRKEDQRNTVADPTQDKSNVSAAEIKGQVTTDAAEIAQWIHDGQSANRVNVIFGTYQSGRRIADALQKTGVAAQVLIADEAHRTAGLRRKRPSQSNPKTQPSPEEQRLRDFTLCHDNAAFPAIYRIYQTATPRIYDTSRVNRELPSDWVVRTMDDETVFGVELYRKSYVEAVRNGWLSDYRIIALGVNDPEAYRQANLLAANTRSKGRQALTTTDYLRGLALALTLGGATQDTGQDRLPIKSCIAFMNTVDKSKNMAADLQTDTVRQWLNGWMRENREGQAPAHYRLEHLDATNNVTTRDNAKRRLAEATETAPYGIINVGIFGEGADAPSLSAVAFLESRKSPIDVIQAVGRVMRTTPDKELGYIICPILIPPNVDPEQWLSLSNPEDGWQELGQILLALRAHDQRIEDNLSELLQLYIPAPPSPQSSVITIVAFTDARKKNINYRIHVGPPGEAARAVERTLREASRPSREFQPYNRASWQEQTTPEAATVWDPPEPALIITGKRNNDGTIELREDAAQRGKPTRDGRPGPVDLQRSRDKARKMINDGQGHPVQPAEKRPRRRCPDKAAPNRVQQMLLLSGLADHGNAITMNLLAKSGLTNNRVVRDLNLLESSVKEAAHHLNSDNLQPALDRHFGLDNLEADKRRSQADGCTIAALLLLNAAMLHQRIANGRWLAGLSALETIKNDVNVATRIRREWERIMRHDFRPVLEPAVKAIEVVEDTGKLTGLERALRHITAEAERLAETYADMGADHAGPLFNRVMGNQASDGAYFTRPVAASIAARLTLDAAGDVDWSHPATWREHQTVDLACGSGTLLAAMLTDLKRRARAEGASEAQLADLQKLAVEETIKGLDINPVSLQLAASQLTAGNQEIRYRQMGLYLMPYGPQTDNPAQVATGTLELLGQKAIVARDGELALADAQIRSQSIWPTADAELEDAVDAVKDARIVIMNPPFTNRSKMGEKFTKEVQQALRKRTDSLEDILVQSRPEWKNLASRNTVTPCFVTLAERCLPEATGILTMLNPTIALSNPSGLRERQILAQKFHIDTVLTCHQPGNVNLSQHTNINESIIVMRRHQGDRPPTRFINLDRLPVDDADVDDLHHCLLECEQGPIANGWGEVSRWPAARIAAGDWTPAIWRAPELAEAARQFSAHKDMRTIREHGYSCQATREMMKKKNFIPAEPGNPGRFSIIDSKGADGQITVRSTPDAEWQPTNPDEEKRRLNGGTYPQVDRLLQKAGFLLITSGQRTSTARLNSVADDDKYVGRGWLPITGPNAQEAKATAIFLNSTAGRIQLLRNAGRTLEFPQYNPEPLEGIRIPNVADAGIRKILADCWERTRDMEVPQFRDGECEVRRLWDEAVAEAMGWDAGELARLRQLLHNEPHVRGLGYNQYADAVEDEDTDEAAD